MTQRTVPLSALSLAGGNPRRSYDKARIVGLADSIHVDGLLQNLIVEQNGNGGFHIVGGKRRYLALKLLEKRRVIDGTYKVPVTVKKLKDGDALRIATVENIQREALDPIDEAEAFATLLQRGSLISQVAAKTGVSESTVRRRLALADLCPEAKNAVRSGAMPLAVAEALTLGSPDQQRFFVEALKDGAYLDPDEIRNVFLSEKPSVSMAIFPVEQYTGTLTSDLFGDEDTTLFDDVDQFFELQGKAVSDLAERHGKRAAFVDVREEYSVPWWQYRKAERGEKAGVVIHLAPTGRVEVRTKLVHHDVSPDVVAETAASPIVPKERPPYGPTLLRYAAHQKSIAVQAALLAAPRTLREVVAVLLLRCYDQGSRIRIDPHSCLRTYADYERPPKAYGVVREAVHALIRTLGIEHDAGDGGGAPLWPLVRGVAPVELLGHVRGLEDDALDRLILIIPLLTFGQECVNEPALDESLFNRVASDLNLAMREWWTPDEEFLGMLRRDQLEAIAVECGAAYNLGPLASYRKPNLGAKIAAHFARTADPSSKLDEIDQKSCDWLPAIMSLGAPADA